MLYDYQSQVQRLLADINQQTIHTADLVYWINSARKQVAGEGECIRGYTQLAVTTNVNNYSFSQITGLPPGSSEVLNVRTIWYKVGTGQKWVRGRSFSWYSIYYLNNPVPQSGAPEAWTQFSQGVNGSIFIYPNPDTFYTFNMDCVVLPSNLVSDVDPEAIPYPWTDAVPYFAAYLAYLTAQRMDAATNMYKLYKEFMSRARANATPSIMPSNFEQVSEATSRRPPQDQGTGG